MTTKAPKPDDTVKAFSHSEHGFKKYERVKKPNHIPKPRKKTLYGSEIADIHGNLAPFFAHPQPLNNTLN